MKPTRNELEHALKKWNLAWDNHDLEGVMDLFHEDVQFDN
ncbi:MAG: nuclear transport factor 2 family protein [Deltaproteobacteria bacterium]|nr:nuclear transport factor 2 family protein [Deltaproteobacteria bacterium]